MVKVYLNQLTLGSGWVARLEIALGCTETCGRIWLTSSEFRSFTRGMILGVSFNQRRSHLKFSTLISLPNLPLASSSCAQCQQNQIYGSPSFYCFPPNCFHEIEWDFNKLVPFTSSIFLSLSQPVFHSSSAIFFGLSLSPYSLYIAQLQTCHNGTCNATSSWHRITVYGSNSWPHTPRYENSASLQALEKILKSTHQSMQTFWVCLKNQHFYCKSGCHSLFRIPSMRNLVFARRFTVTTQLNYQSVNASIVLVSDFRIGTMRAQ